jgi:hypothetical protein
MRGIEGLVSSEILGGPIGDTVWGDRVRRDRDAGATYVQVVAEPRGSGVDRNLPTLGQKRLGNYLTAKSLGARTGCSVY